jgi:hypothetical protein
MFGDIACVKRQCSGLNRRMSLRTAGPVAVGGRHVGSFDATDVNSPWLTRYGVVLRRREFCTYG